MKGAECLKHAECRRPRSLERWPTRAAPLQPASAVPRAVRERIRVAGMSMPIRRAASEIHANRRRGSRAPSGSRFHEEPDAAGEQQARRTPAAERGQRGTTK